MSNIVFHADAGHASVGLSNTPAISVASAGLSAGGPVMASHSDGAWRIGDVALSRITCEGPIHLELEALGERRRFGPFTDLVIGANTIWSAAGAFARYNAFTQAWQLTGEEAEPLVVGSPDWSLAPCLPVSLSGGTAYARA